MSVIDTKHLTFADYLNLPTIMQRYDIVNGEMVMSAAPTPRHQLISANIFLPLNAYLHVDQRGTVFYAPCDIVIQKDPLRTRQPDLFAFLRGRADVGDLAALLDEPVIERAPDGTSEGVRTVGIYGVGMRMHSEILDGFALAIDDIFA